MKLAAKVSGLALLLLAAVAPDHALGCGDKLVVVGRGRHPSRPRGGPAASILVYAKPQGSLPAALDQGHLRRDLEHAGHRLLTVASHAELTAALSSGSYDLVLTDLGEAASVEAEAARTPSKPTVLPTLFEPTEAELRAAAQYQCVVQAPRATKDYLEVVNDAMTARAKQGAPGARK